MTDRTDPFDPAYEPFFGEDIEDPEDGFLLDDEEDDDQDDGAWWRRDRTPSAPVSARGYMSGLWSRQGFTFGTGGTVADRADDLVVAHKMVSAFVQTFAGSESYAVTFDPTVSVAGTDYNDRKVVISPLPVLDPTLDSEQAATILTAVAAHESAHVRYGGKSIRSAVQRAFGSFAAGPAGDLANILEDRRINRQFATEYPGYAHAFDPAVEYVAKRAAKAMGVDRLPAASDNPMAIVINSLIYADHVDFTGVEAERDWWIEWADRWNATTGSRPRIVVDAVREALQHMAADQDDDVEAGDSADQAGPSSDQPGQGRQGEGQAAGDPDDQDAGEEAGQGDGQGSGESAEGDGDGQGDGQGDEPAENDQSGQGDADGDDPTGGTAGGFSAASSAPQPQSDADLARGAWNKTVQATTPTAPIHPYDVGQINATAKDNGAKDKRGNASAEAQQIIFERATSDDIDMTEIFGKGFGTQQNYRVDRRRVEQLPKLPVYARRSIDVQPSPAATAAIRNALMRSRSGHTAIDGAQRRGHLDSGSIHRLAMNDPRLFHRRQAPDPGRYLIWMMTDMSGSMSGDPTDDAVACTKAIAAASRYADSMRMEVFGWTSPQAGAIASNASAISIWRTGEPVDKLARFGDMAQGGTPDGLVLKWATDRITDQARRGERPVIIMLSDGEGYGPEYLARIIEPARRKGIRVVGVGIGEVMSDTVMKAAYGEDYIGWKGDVTSTMQSLARLLGRIVSVQ